MKKRYSREKQETRMGLFFLLPSLIVIVLITFLPIGQTFFRSLFRWDIKFESRQYFTGLSNYTAIFQGLFSPDEALSWTVSFWNSAWVTFLFTIIAVLIETVVGLLIALIINREFRGRGLVRTATLIPWAIPTVASAQMWRMMFSSQGGVINDLAKRLGFITEYVNFLGDSTTTAFWSMVTADAWKTIQFMALLLLAGLQTIPLQLYEAARVDGASKWRQFFSITLPMLKPSLLVALIFRTLDTFKAFDIAQVLTGGGPASGTELLSLFNYKLMIQQGQHGRGSAVAIMLFIFTMLIAFFFIKVLGADPYASKGKELK